MCQEAGVGRPLPLGLVRPSGKSLALAVCVEPLALLPAYGSSKRASLHSGCADPGTWSCTRAHISA